MFPGRFITMWTSGGWLQTPTTSIYLKMWRSLWDWCDRPLTQKSPVWSPTTTPCHFLFLQPVLRGDRESANCLKALSPAGSLSLLCSFFFMATKTFLLWCVLVFLHLTACQDDERRQEKAGENRLSRGWKTKQQRPLWAPLGFVSIHLFLCTSSVCECVCVNNNQLLTITQLSDRNAHRFTFSFVFRWAYVLLGSVSLLIVSVAVSTTPTLLFSVVNYLCKQM